MVVLVSLLGRCSSTTRQTIISNNARRCCISSIIISKSWTNNNNNYSLSRTIGLLSDVKNYSSSSSVMVAAIENNNSLFVYENATMDFNTTTTRRNFSIKKSKRRRQVNNSNEPKYNEELITTLMNQRHDSNITRPEDVQVRIVPDPLLATSSIKGDGNEENQERKGKSQQSVVMSLKEAIQTAIEQDLDLIEIAIEQKIPVVTISDFQRLKYQSSKQSSSNNATIKKEITFRAGIEENDLIRKIDDVNKFLFKKNHMVQVSVIATYRHIRTNPNAAIDAIESFLEKLLKSNDMVELAIPPSSNPQKTNATFTVRSKK